MSSADTPTRLPLPELRPEVEFFWTAGADGVLRICECGDCKSLIHPPQPICRYCRSHNMGVREVSGRGVLAGFTVNHRFSLPGLPAPYVVAQVALEEDPRVRLTTNILVDIDESGGVDLELGQLVEVEFEKADDVYLPLFRPVAPKQLGELPADEIAPKISRSTSVPWCDRRSSRTKPSSPVSAPPGWAAD